MVRVSVRSGHTSTTRASYAKATLVVGSMDGVEDVVGVGVVVGVRVRIRAMG